MKVETHNHPTAISPFPGAATGSGGEIRDEGATGRARSPKAGLTGFSVSNLRIPGACPALGGRPRFGETRPHRLRPRHHARRTDRRRGLQQRIRPAEHSAGTSAPSRSSVPGRRATRCAATTSRSCWPAGSATSAPSTSRSPRSSARRGHRRPRRARHADRPRRRSRFVDGVGIEPVRTSTSRRSSAATPEMQRRCQEVIDRCCGARRGQPDPLDPRRRRRAASRMRCPSWSTTAGAARRFDLREIPNDEPGMSPAGGLVQREPGALRAWRSTRIGLDAFEALCATRALPVRGPRDGHRGGAAARATDDALREHADRPPALGDSRQAAAYDAGTSSACRFRARVRSLLVTSTLIEDRRSVTVVLQLPSRSATRRS